MARTVPSHELHRIVTMGLVYDAEHRFLIVQRSPHAKVFPNKWGSPGGGFSRKDYKNAQTLKDGWEDPLFAGLRRELREEVGIEVGSFEYVPHHFGHIRPDNVSVIGLRFMAPYVSGTVVLNHELVVHHRAEGL